MVPWHSPLAPNDPAKAHHTQGTCVEGPSKDPALAISDWAEARFFPSFEDLHTAVPVPWVPATGVSAAPIPSKHTIVIIAIDLGRNPPPQNESALMPFLGRLTCRIQRTRWGDEEGSQRP